MQNEFYMKIATIKEVQNLFYPTISESKASRMILFLRDVLNKPKPKIITLNEFCEYYGLNYSD